MTARTDRLDAQLREEIGAILARDVADPRIGFVTVTNIETAPDLSHASVWVSVIGSAEERRQSIRALRGAMPFVRRELGSRLRLRRVPALHVRLDDAAERATRTMRILEGLESGDEAVAGSIEPLPTPGHHSGDGADEG